MTEDDDPGPQALKQTLRKLIADRGWARKLQTEDLHERWKKVAGERIAKWTRIKSIRNGTVNVQVSNSTLLNELVSFHDRNLLARMKTEFQELRIQQLKFKLGAVRNRD